MSIGKTELGPAITTARRAKIIAMQPPAYLDRVGTFVDKTWYSDAKSLGGKGPSSAIEACE
jgi:hypothetical protein